MQTHQNMAISAANRHNTLNYFISFLAVTVDLCCLLHFYIFILSSQFIQSRIMGKMAHLMIGS